MSSEINLEDDDSLCCLPFRIDGTHVGLGKEAREDVSSHHEGTAEDALAANGK